MKKKKTAASYELAEFKNCKLWCYSTLCPINEFNDPVDWQHQLEFISPPKPPGKHLLCYLAILTWRHRLTHVTGASELARQVRRTPDAGPMFTPKVEINTHVREIPIRLQPEKTYMQSALTCTWRLHYHSSSEFARAPRPRSW